MRTEDTFFLLKDEKNILIYEHFMYLFAKMLFYTFLIVSRKKLTLANIYTLPPAWKKVKSSELFYFSGKVAVGAFIIVFYEKVAFFKQTIQIPLK